MKTPTTHSLLLLLAVSIAGALALPAQAKLTPRDGLVTSEPVDVVSLYAGPAGAELERSYFIAPSPEPTVSHRAGRCTVQAIVFEKMRLAQACY